MKIDASATHIDRKTIRSALRDWDSLKRLSTSNLMNLRVIQQRRVQKGYTDSSIGYGLALREVLQETLEGMRPESEAENPNDKRWRPYFILREQFLNGRKPEWIQAQIHISKAAYYLEQEHALDLLAERLEKTEDDAQPSGSNLIKQRRLYGMPSSPPYNLVGRENGLTAAIDHLTHASVRTLGVTGLPGIGKTTFLLALAHHPAIQAYFSDGILWVGLGRNPDLFDLLGGWAGALGFTDEQIAGRRDLAARMQLIQKEICERRMLLVIDDAWSAEDALAFRLGGMQCACLISSRQAEVLLDSGADQVLSLPELDSAASLQLLNQIAPRAFELAPQETQALLESIAGLPLGLILIGSYLQKQSFNGQVRRVQAAIHQLASPQVRLKLSQPPNPLIGQYPALRFGERLSLQTIIGLSDAQLDALTHQALLALAVFPPKPVTFSEEAALAVMHAPVHCLDALVDAGLVESRGNGRYTLHQSIHDYACGQEQSAEAIHRLIAYYADFLAHQFDYQPKLDEDELANILHSIDLARQTADDEGYLSLSLGIYSFLEVRGRYGLSKQLLAEARQKALTSGSTRALVQIEYQFGNLEIKHGNFLTAIEHLQKGLILAQEISDAQIESNIHLELSLAYSYSGRADLGQQHVERALDLVKDLPPSESKAFALVARGYYDEELCNFSDAIQHLDAAYRYCLANGAMRSAGWAQYNLSVVYLPLGEYDQCWQTANACRSYYEQIGDLRGITWLDYHLGRIYRQQGNYEAALNYFRKAESFFTDLDDRMGLGFAVLSCGLVQNESGHDFEAEKQYQRAQELFEHVNCIGIASVHYYRGKLALKREDYSTAESELETARKLFIAVDFPRGEAKARGQLAMLRALQGGSIEALEQIQTALTQMSAMQAGANTATLAVLAGHIALSAGQPELAKAQFQQALEKRAALNLSHLLYEPLAGLAAAFAACADLAQAAQLAQQAVQQINAFAPYRPVRVERPLECYRYLLDNLDGHDSAGRDLIQSLRSQEIQRIAAQISSPAVQQAFLDTARL